MNVAPLSERGKHRDQFMPRIGEHVAAARPVTGLLIVDNVQDAGLDQFGQPGTQYIGGNTEPLAELREP